MSDGDLTNVNPELLKLCQDPSAWREQRKQAMRARIFGKDGASSTATTAAGASHYMPKKVDGDDEAEPHSRPVAPHQATKGDESFVLQQIQLRKRQREEATTAAANAPAPMPTPIEESGEKSLKARLLEKMKQKQIASGGGK